MTIVRVIRNRGAVASSGGGGSDEAPDWANEMALDEWTVLPTTNIFMDVGAPDVGQYSTFGPEAVYGAWNGGALVNYGPHKSIFFWGGGHNDYFGNEIYRLDLSTLTFHRMTEPSTAGNAFGWFNPAGGDCPDGILSDGTPNSAHTYWFQCGRGATFVLGKRQVNRGEPASVNKISIFNPATLQWTNSTASHSIAPSAYDGMCLDTLRDRIWMVQMDPLAWAAWNPNTDSWSNYPEPTSAFAPGAGPLYIPSKDCVILFRNATNDLVMLDPGSPTTNRIVRATTGDLAPVTTRGSGASWSSNLNAAVYNPEDSDDLFLLAPPSGDWRTDAWTWSQRPVTGSSGTHYPHGAFSKFQVVEYGTVTLAVLPVDPFNAPRAVRLS